MFKRIAILVSCSMALAAGAQSGAGGKAAEVRGLVTVSDGNTVRTARSGAILMNGSRVVTSSNGRVFIRLDNGCELSLEPNQSVVIDDEKECKVLAESIETLGGGPRFAFLPGRDVANSVLYLLGAAWILGTGSSSSPSTGPGPGPDPGGGGGPVPITPE